MTAAPRAVVHFFHRDFERCRIMDKHLAALAPRHFSTRFLKLSAPVRATGAGRRGGRSTDGAVARGWGAGRMEKEE